MLSDSKIRCPGFFLNIFLLCHCQLKKMYDLFLSSPHNFGISGKWRFEDYITSIGPGIWKVWLLDALPSLETSNLCAISKQALIVHKFNILQS